MTNAKRNTDKAENANAENANAENTNAENTNAENENAENENAEIVEKAKRVLRAKLPALSERNFNFEKRTGSVFTASIVKVFDDEGRPVLENNVQKEKLSRKVVDVENEDGEMLPEFEDIAIELSQKRSAALVLTFESTVEKLDKKTAEAIAAVEALKAEKALLLDNLSIAKATVMEVDLPERATSLNVSAKLTQATDKLAKMKAMLLAAGLSEEDIDEQLN